MTLRAVLSFVLATTVVAPSAHAEEPAPAKKSLRRKVEPPSEVEVIDLTGDRDPQAFALGAHIGGGYLTNVHSIGQGAGHVALVADFGLGANGSRVWSIEPFISFAIPYGVLFQKGGHPNRFTELGARMVYRPEAGLLAHRWVSFGAGLVWTSRRPSSGFFDPSRACFGDPDKAAALGLDCSRQDAISPGLLVDFGIGLHEWVVRRARWGFGVETPLQLSSSPGFAVLGFFYAQVGTAL